MVVFLKNLFHLELGKPFWYGLRKEMACGNQNSLAKSAIAVVVDNICNFEKM